MKILGLFILLSISLSAHAFELVMIQAVSDSKKTFITRNGKREGIQQGMTGTFTAEDVSVLARAISVSGNFTQWQLINPDAIFPFEKGKIITYYAATEYLWALAPESERRKYIKSEIPVLKSSLIFKGSVSRGISETVSDAPANTPTRGSFMGEVYYEKDLIPNLSFDVGIRYEQEVINYTGASFLTRRNIAIVDLNYYFDFLKQYIAGSRLFLGAGFGYGLSQTSTTGLKQSGPISLLPTAKIGVALPLNPTWEFIFDGGFEAMTSREEQESGKIQTTTQTNFKLGFGLRKFL